MVGGSKRVVRRVATAVGLLSLMGAVGVWAQPVSAGYVMAPEANVTDCTWGPFLGYMAGPGGDGGFGFNTAVVRNQNCIAIQIETNDVSLSNGTVQVTIPKGMTVTKKIAAPSNATYFGMTGCTWGGSFSLKAAGTAQTLSLKGVSCGTNSYLAAFFTATVKVPVTVTYLPFNLFNVLIVQGYLGSGPSDCESALQRIFGPSFLNVIGGYYGVLGPLSGYMLTGSYSTSSRGSLQPLENSGDSFHPFQVVADLDYYNWLNWWYESCGFA